MIQTIIIQEKFSVEGWGGVPFEGKVEFYGDGLGDHPLVEGLEYVTAKLIELLAFSGNIAYVVTRQRHITTIRVLDSRARRTHPHIVTKADEVWYSKEDIDFSEVST